MNWKPAEAIFKGGTEGIRALVGKRVRAKRTCILPPYAPSTKGVEGIEIRMGRVGILTNPNPDMLNLIVIAFPSNEHQPVTNITLGSLKDFMVVCINESTFCWQFEVEQ